MYDEANPTPFVLVPHEEWSIAVHPFVQTALDRLSVDKRARRETRLKHAKLTFFGTVEEEVTNSHILQQVFPDKEIDQINNPPSLVGMINSLPFIPPINLPQSILTLRTSVENVFGKALVLARIPWILRTRTLMPPLL